LHGQISGLLASEDAINVASGLPKWIDRVYAIRDQPSIGSEVAVAVNSRDVIRRGKLDADRGNLAEYAS
jgi:hypothetical protein